MIIIKVNLSHAKLIKHYTLKTYLGMEIQHHIFLTSVLRRDADKFLAFHIVLFGLQPKQFFLGWVKEVRTTKS
jgi:hypothetical protein